MAAAFAGAPTTATSATDSITIARPAGAANGEYILVHLESYTTATPTLVLPDAKWVMVADWYGPGDTYLAFAARPVDGTEGASFTFSVTSSGITAVEYAIANRISGADQNPADFGYGAATANTASGNSGTHPSLTTVANNDLAVWGGILFASGTPTGAQWNNVASTGQTMVGTVNDPPQYVGVEYYAVPAAGPTGNKTAPTPPLTSGANFLSLGFVVKSALAGVSGSGAGTAGTPAGSGSGAIAVAGAGSGAAPAPAASGSGTVADQSVSGDGAGGVSGPEGSGTGVLVNTGSGDGEVPPAAGSGGGAVDFAGDGAGAGAGPGGAGDGAQGVTGEGSGAAPPPGAGGDGTLDVAGSGDGKVPAPQGDGSGTIVAPGVSGDGAGQASAPEATGSGQIAVQGGGGGAPAGPGGTGIGTQDLAGSGAGTADAPTGIGTGQVADAIGGDGAGEVPRPSGSGGGTVTTHELPVSTQYMATTPRRQRAVLSGPRIRLAASTPRIRMVTTKARSHAPH